MLKYKRTVKAFCTYPFQRLKITSEGNVTMSCFQKKGCLGNILEKGNNVQKIWCSALAKEVREFTEKGDLHPTCQINSCPYKSPNNRVSMSVITCDHPTEFEIDLPSQHCNIGGENPTAKNPACLMCDRHRNKDFHQEDRLMEVCQKLNPHMGGIKQLHIQGISEPFWKDKIFDLLEWLDFDKHKHRCSITTTTNGTLLNKKVRDRFLKYPNSILTWSLDAGSPEVFKIIRRINAYPAIVKNLSKYSKERSSSQKINIHNNINVINICDVVKMVELAADVKTDRLEFNPTYFTPSIEVNKDNVHIFHDAQEKIIKRSKELGVNVIFMRPLTLDFKTSSENSQTFENHLLPILKSPNNS